MAKTSQKTKPKTASTTKTTQSKLASTAPATKKSAPIGFAPGTKVTHKKFGRGKVLSQRGDILLIEFGKNETREILADYIDRA